MVASAASDSAGVLESNCDFERLIRPRAVGIIGASADLNRIGGQPLRALTEFGYAGGVYPVNPKYKTLKGLTCYPDITAVPRPCDVAIVAVPAREVPRVIDQCGDAGVSFAIVLSSGFREMAERGAALQDELVEAAKRSGVRIIGPNCQGVMNLVTRLYCGFGTTFQKPELRGGPLAMVTQSGGFGYGVVTVAQAAGIGFNYVVSTGNEADVDTLDLIEFFLEQDDIEIVTTYMEGIKDGRRLLALGKRALDLGKPIVVWKVGNSRVGRRAALSHTANLTSGAELYRAVFRQGGFIEIREIEDLIDVARAFMSRRLPHGPNVAVVTASGGAGVLLADRCDERGFYLPDLREETKAELRKIMPEFAAVANPIDITAQLSADPLKSNQVVSMLLEDPAIDQIVIRKGNAVGKVGLEWARGLVEVSRQTDKPILVSIPVDRSEETLNFLDQHRIPWFPTPGRAVTGAAALLEFATKRNRHALAEMPAWSRRTIHWPASAGNLSEHRSKQCLSAYEIPVVRGIVMPLNEIMELTQMPLPAPLAVKVESADIPHKTEAGAVRLRITSLAMLKEAALAIAQAAHAYNPQARIDGVLVQEMATGTEMIVGVINDAYFGPVVVLGLGGIFAEVLGDVTHRCAPVNVSTAHVMIEELRGSAVLKGARGRPAADVGALAEAISRISMLAVDHADRIAEIDINPLFVRPAGEGVVAADALIVLH